MMNKQQKNWYKQQQEYYQRQNALSDFQRRKLETQRMKQRQQQPVLTYDTDLLKRINSRCLNENENIHINYSGVDYGLVKYIMYLDVGGKPVSQIELGFGQDYMPLHYRLVIVSYTRKKYRKKHYNTLLRCVLVMLMPDMKINGHPIVKVFSHAENSLSIYVLTKLGFEADSMDLSFYNPFMTMKQQQSVRKEKQQQLKKFIVDNNDEDIYMVLLKDNYKNSVILARSVLNRLLHDCLQRKIEDRGSKQIAQKQLLQSLDWYDVQSPKRKTQTQKITMRRTSQTGTSHHQKRRRKA